MENTELSQHHLDAQDLAKFGYQQKLHRSLGTFSAFAAGYSYISVLTGMFELFGFGYGFGGPPIVFMWIFVFLGQMTVAYCFAELSARFPIAGSVYQWSKQLSKSAVAWVTGWTMLIGSVVTLAAVAIALQIVLPPVWSGFELFKNTSQNAVFLGVVILTITTILNAAGVKVMSVVNNIGVAAELIGVTLFVILLALHVHNSPSIFLKTEGTGPGLPGYSSFGYGAGLILAIIMPAYVMYGFDTAGSLAEETKDPRRRAPRAIITSLLAGGVGGLLILIFALLASPTLNPAKLGAGGLPLIIEGALGSGLGKLLLVDVAVAISVCALAIQTGTIRMTFTMARDNNLPFGSKLAHVSARAQSPVVPSIVSGLLAALILLVNIGKPQLFTIVTSVAVVLVYIAYFLVTIPLLSKRLKGWPADQGEGGLFYMRGWGVIVNGFAAIYGVVMTVNLLWPRSVIYGPGNDAWGGVIFVGVVLVAGLVYFNTVQRHKSGVLEEHRAS
jgi:urea carboxylase system permease